MTQIAEQMWIYIRGWKSYFRQAQTPKIFKDLDSWIRHRLRATHEQAALMAGGAGHWWRHSEAGLNRILTVDYFDALSFPGLA